MPAADTAHAAPQRLIVNGAETSVSATTVSGLLDELGYGDSKVATAVNGDFVSTPLRAATTLADGDRVEIVAPRQGG